MSTVVEATDEEDKIQGLVEKGTASMLTGGALIMYGLLRRDLVGLLCTAGGAGMIATSAAKKTAASWTAVTTHERVPLPILGERASKKIKCKRAITISKSIEEVFAFLSTAENLPKFMHKVNRVEAESDTKWNWHVQNLAKGEISWETAVEKNDPSKEIIFSSVGDIESGGTIRFAMQPVLVPRNVAAATVLQVELEYFRPKIGMVAQIFQLLGQDPAQQLEVDLSALKQLLESGEIASNRTV